MPSDPEAISIFQGTDVLFGPGKASNAGGVATSGLEMSQNSMRINWDRDDVDKKLKNIMKNIHSACLNYGQEKRTGKLCKSGANIAGFIKVADAMACLTKVPEHVLNSSRLFLVHFLILLCFWFVNKTLSRGTI